jgi:hypothetical protein
MSAALVMFEAVGVTAATVGIVLAQNPPADLRDWWDRQSWLQWLVMPATSAPDEPQHGLSILPWHRPRRPGTRDAAVNRQLRGDYVNDQADD